MADDMILYDEPEEFDHETYELVCKRLKNIGRRGRLIDGLSALVACGALPAWSEPVELKLTAAQASEWESTAAKTMWIDPLSGWADRPAVWRKSIIRQKTAAYVRETPSDRRRRLARAAKFGKSAEVPAEVEVPEFEAPITYSTPGVGPDVYRGGYMQVGIGLLRLIPDPHMGQSVAWALQAALEPSQAVLELLAAEGRTADGERRAAILFAAQKLQQYGPQITLRHRGVAVPIETQTLES